MGVSIYINTTSSKKAERMVQFINERKEKVLEISRQEYFGYDYYLYQEGSKICLSKISFHHGLKRTIGMIFCRFIALRIGRKQKSFPEVEPKIEPFDEPVPYIRYDGCESWPVLSPRYFHLRKEPFNRYEWSSTIDENGVRAGVGMASFEISNMLYTTKFDDLPQEKLFEFLEESRKAMLYNDHEYSEELVRFVKKQMDPVVEAFQWLGEEWNKQ